MRLAPMKRYATALLFCTLSLTSLAARADIIDDAIGNIQQAINDAYNPGSSRSDDDDRYDDDGRYDDGRYQGSRQQSRDSQRQYDDRQRQLDDRRRQLDERQRQLRRDVRADHLTPRRHLIHRVHQHLRRAALGHVAQRAGADHLGREERVAVHAEHQDAGLRLALEDALGELDAAHAGQRQVEDGEVGLAFAQDLQGLFGGAGLGLDAQVGVFGRETGVAAEFTAGTGGRTVAVLAEYDALPDLGHACGHNIIAATGVGAFLALHRLTQRHPDAFCGRVRFLGTPGEEGHSGKEYMAREGAFDGVDAALMLHPYGYDAADQVWLGRRICRVVISSMW